MYDSDPSIPILNFCFAEKRATPCFLILTAGLSHWTIKLLMYLVTKFMYIRPACIPAKNDPKQPATASGLGIVNFMSSLYYGAPPELTRLPLYVWNMQVVDLSNQHG